MIIASAFGNSAARKLLHALVCFGLLLVCVAQTPRSESSDAPNLADAIAKVKSGRFTRYHVNVIGEARAVEAIPALEKQFTLASDVLDKAKIAQTLLLLGDRNDEYWNYLADLMKLVLDNDSPSPVNFDAQGNHIPGPSNEFTMWARTHGLEPNSAAENSVYVLPGLVMMVGMSGDSRALPLLRRALASPIHQVQVAAAMGLAEMQDSASISLIIAACKQAPAEMKSVLAEALVYFDDPQAQSAVDTFIPKEQAEALREARALGNGPLHSSAQK